MPRRGRVFTLGAARGLLPLAMLVPVILELGWHSRPLGIADGLLHAIVSGLWVMYAWLYGLEAWRRRASRGGWRGYLALHRGELMLVGIGLLLSWWFVGISWCVAALMVLTLVKAHGWLVRVGVAPSAVFLLSFLVLIASGTGLLMLPSATPTDDPIGVLDAAFTSTSAVCVTGLTVRDTGTEFTRFGQTVILVLIQSGGLGIILFGGLLMLAFGGAVDIRSSREITGGVTGLVGGLSVGEYVKRVIGIVLCAEMIGAVILYLAWPVDWVGAPIDIQVPQSRAFHSVFFSVSAFCNAGFSTTGNSLNGLRFHWTTHLVIVSLVTMGGLGMPVIMNLWDLVRQKWRSNTKHPRKRRGAAVRMGLHTKIVLATTLVVYLMGAIGIALSRYTQGDDHIGHALLDAHFMSVSTRTAGFDTIHPQEMGILSRFVMMLQMFVGGSPASTAGGVKTVAVAVFGLTVWNTIRGRNETNVFGRAVPEQLVRKSAVLIVLGFLTVISLAWVLTITDPRGLVTAGDQAEAFEEILFESVSACGTVGLTMGLTPELSDEGKIAVGIGMFLGRVGPLAFLIALAGVRRRHPDSAQYAREDVVMG